MPSQTLTKMAANQPISANDQIHLNQALQKAMQFSSPQKVAKNQGGAVNSSHIGNGHVILGEPSQGRGTSASRLVKPSPLDTKSLNRHLDYSPASAQLPFHSSQKQHSGPGTQPKPFEGIQVQLIPSKLHH